MNVAEPAGPMLVQAIGHRLVVAFSYDGQPRVVQPATLGADRVTGIPTLRGYQVGGRSNSLPPPFWTFFALQRIDELVVTGARFDVDPPHRSTGDRCLHPVVAEL